MYYASIGLDIDASTPEAAAAEAASFIADMINGEDQVWIDVERTGLWARLKQAVRGYYDKPGMYCQRVDGDTVIFP